MTGSSTYGILSDLIVAPLSTTGGSMTEQATVLVTGAGGFIGHHLTSYLAGLGHRVRGVDLKLPEFEPSRAAEFHLADLRRREACLEATAGIEQVYHLAADMGGIGYIERNKAAIVHDNLLIDTHMLEAARVNGASRFLYTSSACVYPGYLQRRPEVVPLREEDAYPADAEDGYGWEKLMAERLCRHYREDHGLATRVVRFHNIFGPLGTWEGGREKSPAAICRKIAAADEHDQIEVWGDGQQTRSYCYVSDCVEGIHRLMQSDHHDPVNLGQDRMVTIDELVDLVSRIAGKRIAKRHDPSKPQGVRGRNADIGRMREVLGWEPTVSLEDGLARTYGWICEQLGERARAGSGLARSSGPAQQASTGQALGMVEAGSRRERGDV
jgi:nucleoside-diphosphate-sugar epimerase